MRRLFIHLCGSIAEIKFAHHLIEIRVYYVCWHNTRRDSLLTCRGLKLFYQNVKGLHAKLNLITVFLCGRNINFLKLSETRTQNIDNFEIFSIPWYHYIGKSRATGTGGGVDPHISDKHDFTRRKNLELTDIESSWIEIRIKKSKNILLCTTQRPPGFVITFHR